MTDDTSIDPVIERLSESRCGVVLDIDETLLNPLPLYHTHINAAMSLQISVRQIEEAGGLDGFFRQDARYEEFQVIANRLRADETFNSDVPLVEGAREGVALLEALSGVAVGAYLTTRPISVRSVTVKDLSDKGFPPAPVLARPGGVVRESTVEWKVSVLQSLNSKFAGTVIAIDDSLALARAIRSANKHSEKAIVAVLYPGPLTYTAIATEDIDSAPEEHFYVASWEEIPRICDRYSRGSV